MKMQHIAYYLVIMTLLSGCAPGISDLVTYTEDVKARTQVSIEPYPEFSTPVAFSYGASDMRSPFTRSQNNQAPLFDASKVDCLQPDFDRPRQALEKYGLDALKMAGTMVIDGQKWALISANDGSVHKARVSSPIGLYYGTISAIAGESITITQLLPDGAGCWQKKDTVLTRSRAIGEE